MMSKGFMRLWIPIEIPTGFAVAVAVAVVVVGAT
jgi:hypothetical protein